MRIRPDIDRRVCFYLASQGVAVVPFVAICNIVGRDWAARCAMGERICVCRTFIGACPRSGLAGLVVVPPFALAPTGAAQLRGRRARVRRGTMRALLAIPSPPGGGARQRCPVPPAAPSTLPVPPPPPAGYKGKVPAPPVAPSHPCKRARYEALRSSHGRVRSARSLARARCRRIARQHRLHRRRRGGGRRRGNGNAKKMRPTCASWPRLAMRQSRGAAKRRQTRRSAATWHGLSRGRHRSLLRK